MVALPPPFIGGRASFSENISGDRASEVVGSGNARDGLLADVASDCSNFPVPISGDIVDALFDDILETLRVMEASRTLSVVSVRPLLAAAFRISCQSLMTLSDALVVVLAVSQGIPVLIGDETARERIHASSVLGVVPEVVSVSEL